MTPRELVTRCVAWALVAGCLVTIAAMFLAGARVSSYNDLRSAVAGGRVDEVRVAGGLEDGPGRGQALAEVYWRDRWISRVTQVRESTVRERDTWTTSSSGDVPTVRGQVDDDLLSLDPDLGVTRSGQVRGTNEIGFHVTFGGPAPVRGWQVPGWAALLGLGVFLGSLGLLILGPEPHRATRWAWFWLLGLAAPMGTLAFLFLGGATSFRPTPARKEGRLTGGWAFLLSFLIGSALATLGAVVL